MANKRKGRRPKKVVRRRNKKVSSKRCSKKLKSLKQAIKALKRMKGTQRSQAIASANANFIKQFSNAVRKSRHNRVSNKVASALKAKRKQVRAIANPRVAISRKRKLLSQKGGALSAVLPLVLETLFD